MSCDEMVTTDCLGRPVRIHVKHILSRRCCPKLTHLNIGACNIVNNFDDVAAELGRNCRCVCHRLHYVYQVLTFHILILILFVIKTMIQNTMRSRVTIFNCFTNIESIVSKA